MKVKSVLRIVCLVCLLTILLLELFIVQPESLVWYDWLLLAYSTIFVIPSLIKEFITDEEEKKHIEFDFNLDFEVGYVYTRIVNAVLMGCVIWKTCLLSQQLPIPIILAWCLILSIGLYTIFNSIYYFISLLMTGSIVYILESSTIVGLWQIPAILTVVATGVGIMVYMYRIVMERDEEMRNGRFKVCELKRKEQEIEELKKEIRKLKWAIFTKSVSTILLGI